MTAVAYIDMKGDTRLSTTVDVISNDGGMWRRQRPLKNRRRRRRWRLSLFISRWLTGCPRLHFVNKYSHPMSEYIVYQVIGHFGH